MQSSPKRRRVQLFWSKDILSVIVKYLGLQEVADLRLVCKSFAKWIKPKVVQSLWNDPKQIRYANMCSMCERGGDNYFSFFSKHTLIYSLKNGTNPCHSGWSKQLNLNDDEILARYWHSIDEYEKNISCKCQNYLWGVVDCFHPPRTEPQTKKFLVRCKHEIWCSKCFFKIQSKFLDEAKASYRFDKAIYE